MSCRVLIVDDSAFMRLRLREILESLGATVVGEAANGLDGIKQFLKLSPDLVLLDITMPDIDGLTVLREMLELDSQAKIIMVSALSQKSVIREALQSGARDYIIKPLDPLTAKEVLAKIQ